MVYKDRMIYNNSALSDDERAVIKLLEPTSDQVEKRKKALEVVKSGLSSWMAKPLSNFRYQTPDEQFENDNDRLIVPVDGSK
jgi:hypothetical protein